MKAQGLIDFYGLTGTNFRFANTEITGDNVVVGGTGSFTTTVENADVNNTPEISEPGTLALLGSGLLGLGVLMRRRKASSQDEPALLGLATA